MLAKIIYLFKKKTVASLMSAFTALADELRELADSAVIQANVLKAEAAELMSESDAQVMEAEQALLQADKIDAIFKPAL